MASKPLSRLGPVRILIGCSVRQEQAVFDAYYANLRALKAPRNCELSFAFVYDDTELQMPTDCAILPAPERPVAAMYAVDSVTHRWNVETFEHLAQCKQLLLDYATAERFDYILLVDSDLLLEPTTLISLYAHDVDVVNACFWTQWTPAVPPMPQCWLQHPYGLAGLGMRADEYINALNRAELVRVIGGGACTLIKCNTLDRLKYHPRLSLPMDGMWQGEDRSFAVRCQQAHIAQYCDAWPSVLHAYHPHQRTSQALAEARIALNVPQQLFAKMGDWVNLHLMPMEDAMLQEHIDPRACAVRGRLGAIPLAIELEDALIELRVGDKRIVDYVTQPGNPAYPPGQRKAIMMELIDARPH